MIIDEKNKKKYNMTREDAIALATPHKDKSEEIYVTEDGNVFFQPQKNFAINHQRRFFLEMFTLTPEDFGGKKAKEEESSEDDTAGFVDDLSAMKFGKLKKYAEEQGYPVEEWQEFKSKKDILIYLESKKA